MTPHDGIEGIDSDDTLLSLFSRNAFGDIDFGGSVVGRIDPKQVLPDPDEDLEGLGEKTSRVASLVLAHKSIAGMMGMLTEEGDISLTHEKLVLGQSSPLEKVQRRAWREGYRLPPMSWSAEQQDAKSLLQRPGPPARRQIEDGQPVDVSFATSCMVKALRELYADEIDGLERSRGGSRLTPPPSEEALPPNGREADEMAVTPIDVATFEDLYPALRPLLRVQAKIVASMSNTVAKEHLGVECELQERRCAVHLVQAYEEQLRVAMSHIQAQIELVRHNCEVIRSRANAMSAPFDDQIEALAEAESESAPRDRPRDDRDCQLPRGKRDVLQQPPTPTLPSLRHLTQRHPSARTHSYADTVEEVAKAPPTCAGTLAVRTRSSAVASAHPAIASSSVKRFFSSEIRTAAAANVKRSKMTTTMELRPSFGGSMGPPPPPTGMAYQSGPPTQSPASQQAFFDVAEQASGGAAATSGERDRGSSAGSSPRLPEARAPSTAQDEEVIKRGNDSM